jgi:hypothetical protein
MPDGLGKKRQLRFWRTKPVGRGDFPAVSLAVILMTIGAAADSGQEEPPQIELHQAAYGTLLRDDFESGAINRDLWSVSV